MSQLSNVNDSVVRLIIDCPLRGEKEEEEKKREWKDVSFFYSSKGMLLINIDNLPFISLIISV